MRRLAAWIVVLSLVAPTAMVVALFAGDAGAPATPAPAATAPAPGPGLGDPGKLDRIAVEFGLANTDGFKLSGRDARQQLVVSGHFSSSQIRDLTHKVAYDVEPKGIVEVDKTGLVSPVAEGQATVTALHPDGQTSTAKVTVSQIAQDQPVNFANDVVPVFTKFGCNSGGCHGKASGQNGFKLSLLGFEPKEDFEHLVMEARGRRLFPAAPDAACC